MSNSLFENANHYIWEFERDDFIEGVEIWCPTIDETMGIMGEYTRYCPMCSENIEHEIKLVYDHE